MVQQALCANARGCYEDDYPTLALIRRAYGEGAPIQWLIPQLLDLNAFCGCGAKFTEQRYYALASLISTEYYYLKVSELMLFFFRLKGGHYGSFYGSIDPMKITEALNKFVAERMNLLSKYEAEARQKQREENNRHCMSYEEWCKLKGREPSNKPQIHLKTAKSVAPQYSEEEKLKRATDIVLNPNHLTQPYIDAMERDFTKRFGVTPKDYILNYDTSNKQHTD